MISTVGILAGLLLPHSRFAQGPFEAPVRFERTFPVGPAPGLVLVNSSLRGDIRIHTWDRREIHIVASFSSPTFLPDARLSGDVVTVRIRKPRAKVPDRVDFEVKIPADCAIEASTMSGKIFVRGARGRMKLSTVDGDIELVDVSSPHIDAMSITTGRITFSGTLHERGTYTLYSGGGDIEVFLPERSSFTLDASTHEGRIEPEGIPMREKSRLPSHLQGISGTGNALLRLRTHSGQIRVRRR